MFRKDKILLLIFSGFFASIFCASALSKFPIGSGRIDIFTYPLTLMIISLGFLETSNFLKRYFKYASQCFQLPIICIILLSWIFIGSPNYPRSHDAEFIKRAYALAKAEDAILAYPYANYSLGFYGQGPVNVVPVNYSSNGFEVRPKRPHTYVIPEGVGATRFRNNPMALKPFIEDVLHKNYAKIVYVSCHVDKKKSEVFRSFILDAGYIISSSTSVLANELYVFEKNE